MPERERINRRMKRPFNFTAFKEFEALDKHELKKLSKRNVTNITNTTNATDVINITNTTPTVNFAWESWEAAETAGNYTVVALKLIGNVIWNTSGFLVSGTKSSGKWAIEKVGSVFKKEETPTLLGKELELYDMSKLSKEMTQSLHECLENLDSQDIRLGDIEECQQQLTTKVIDRFLEMQREFHEHRTTLLKQQDVLTTDLQKSNVARIADQQKTVASQKLTIDNQRDILKKFDTYGQSINEANSNLMICQKNLNQNQN